MPASWHIGGGKISVRFIWEAIPALDSKSWISRRERTTLKQQWIKLKSKTQSVGGPIFRGQRAVSRLTKTDRKTVARLALAIGRGAAELHDRMMVGLFMTQPGVIVRYWCEAGSFRP